MAIAAFTVLTHAQSRPRDPGTPSEGTAILRQRIGLDANPKASTKYERDDWTESIRLMKTTGANHYHYAKVWSEIEPRPGVYDTDDVSLKVKQSATLPIAFNLRVVDAGVRNMPDEYKTLAWDSPAMITHVTDVIDRIAPLLGSRPWSYAIGNEIDMYFGRNPSEIAAFGRLLERVKPRVRALHPTAGFTTCLQFAAASQLRSLYAPLMTSMDHVTFTYYPLASDFSVRSEQSLAADLPVMIAAAQPRPIFLQEIGYPTAALLGSSPDRQRTFVQASFDTIRAAGSTRVLGATYLFQADLPQWLVSDISRAYGTSSDRFQAFVATLGLRDDRDRAKPAWDEFVRQAKIIGPVH